MWHWNIIGWVHGKFGGSVDPVAAVEARLQCRIEEVTVHLNRCKVMVARLMQECKKVTDASHRARGRVTECWRAARNAVHRHEDDVALLRLREKAIADLSVRRLEIRGESLRRTLDLMVETVRQLDTISSELSQATLTLKTVREISETVDVLFRFVEGDDAVAARRHSAERLDQLRQVEARLCRLEIPLDPPLQETADGDMAPTRTPEEELATLKAEEFGTDSDP